MTFQNLLKIGQLKEHSASATDVQKMLAAARRNLKDAALVQLSGETRFDCAYKAIMQGALVAMWGEAGVSRSIASRQPNRKVMQDFPWRLSTIHKSARPSPNPDPGTDTVTRVVC